MARRVSLTGARTWVPGILFKSAPIQNLETIRRYAPRVELLLLGISTSFDHGHLSAIFGDVITFVVFYAFEKLFKRLLSQLRALGLPKEVERCIRIALLVALLPITIVHTLHRPTDVSDYLMLYAEEILDFVEVFGNWGFYKIPKTRTSLVHKHAVTALNGMVALTRVPILREGSPRLLRQTTSVESRASPPTRGWLCSFV